MHIEIDDVAGVSRQGGSGTGGGVVASRHQAIRISGRRHLSRRAGSGLDCTGCSQPLTGATVVVGGRVYCTWDCAVSVAGTVPGLYFG
jgi:hypothetical protein